MRRGQTRRDRTRLRQREARQRGERWRQTGSDAILASGDADGRQDAVAPWVRGTGYCAAAKRTPNYQPESRNLCVLRLFAPLRSSRVCLGTTPFAGAATGRAGRLWPGVITPGLHFMTVDATQSEMGVRRACSPARGTVLPLDLPLFLRHSTAARLRRFLRPHSGINPALPSPIRQPCPKIRPKISANTVSKSSKTICASS